MYGISPSSGTLLSVHIHVQWVVRCYSTIQSTGSGAVLDPRGSAELCNIQLSPAFVLHATLGLKLF